MTTETVKNIGNYQEWNDILKTGSDWITDESLLFTKGKPKNLRQFWQRCYFNDLDSLIKDKNFSTFLELGSGRGTTSLYLSNSGYKDITMLDLAPEAFKMATGLFDHASLDVPKFVTADVRDTGLPDKSFDCIYNIGLLEHFEDPEPVLRETCRLLKPGGLMFMVIIPDYPFSKSIFSRIFLNPISVVKYIVKKITRKQSVGKIEMTRTPYPGKYYSDILNKLGESDVKCIPYNPYHKVFIKDKWVNLIALPVFKSYYKVKGLFGVTPLLKSLPSTAFCDLLICFKK